MRKPWAELTADEKTVHRQHCIDNARPDIPKEQVIHMVDLFDIPEHDWERVRLAEEMGYLGDLPEVDLGMGLMAVVAASMAKKSAKQ